MTTEILRDSALEDASLMFLCGARVDDPSYCIIRRSEHRHHDAPSGGVEVVIQEAVVSFEIDDGRPHGLFVWNDELEDWKIVDKVRISMYRSNLERLIPYLQDVNSRLKSIEDLFRSGKVNDGEAEG